MSPGAVCPKVLDMTNPSPAAVSLRLGGNHSHRSFAQRFAVSADRLVQVIAPVDSLTGRPGSSVGRSCQLNSFESDKVLNISDMNIFPQRDRLADDFGGHPSPDCRIGMSFRSIFA